MYTIFKNLTIILIVRDVFERSVRSGSGHFVGVR